MRDSKIEPKAMLRVTARWKSTYLDSAVIREAREVTIGGIGDEADLHVDAEELRGSLARIEGTKAIVRIPKAAKGGALRPEESTRVDGEVTLSIGQSLWFEVRKLRIELSLEPDDGEARKPRWALPDSAFTRSLGIMAAAHIAFAVTSGFVEAAPKLEPPVIRHHGVRFLSELTKPPLPATERSPGKPSPEPGPAGKAVGPKKTKIERPLNVKEAGILGLLKGSKGSLSGIFAPASASALATALAGVQGGELAGLGGTGLGSRGDASGGDGSAIGIGFGARGLGASCDAACEAARSLGVTGRGHVGVGPTRGPTKVIGGLSKEDVATVIRRNHARFRFCYERELNAKPTLGGKISIRFTIAPTGRVADALVDESSLGDPSVEGCVTRVMQSLEFKAPRGGGIVVVSYPFVFTSA